MLRQEAVVTIISMRAHLTEGFLLYHAQHSHAQTTVLVRWSNNVDISTSMASVRENPQSRPLTATPMGELPQQCRLTMALMGERPHQYPQKWEQGPL